MSIVFRRNFLSQSYMLGVRLSNFQSIAPQINNISKIKTLTPLSQTRHCSTKQENEKVELRKIYIGKLSSSIKRVKYFSLTSSVASIGLQPYLLYKTLELGNYGTALSISVIFCFFGFGTPLLLHLITRKYVTEMSYDPKRKVYIATVLDLFVRPRQIEFTPEDVEECTLGQVMTTCYAKGEPIFLDAQSFTNPLHYAKIMGYDKPMDFGLLPPVEKKVVENPSPKKLSN